MNQILQFTPFDLPQNKKQEVFYKAVMESVRIHYRQSKEYKNLCVNRNFDPSKNFKLEDLPYMHISAFKKLDLLSTPLKNIIKTLLSSSTSGRPSRIYIDKATSDNQRVALQKILGDFFGNNRKPFVIFDTLKTAEANKSELQSRATAIRGFLSMSQNFNFILDKDLKIDPILLKNLKTSSLSNIVYFGFSWLIYSVLAENENTSLFFKQRRQKDAVLIHIGGWKKLSDIGISKNQFNNLVSQKLKIPKKNIFDIYGMTEQLGTIYPDCLAGYKHVPVYTDIIIRNFDTLKPSSIGANGFIQLISPLPESYPGISILSDDIGKIIGIDDCKCGRKGKYFVFVKRSNSAEIKGCGDTLNI